MVPNQGHNAWKLDPPAGCRFANEMGGEVTLYFPRGREKEIHDSIIKSVHEQYLRATQSPAPVFASSVAPMPAKNLIPDHAVFNPAQVHTQPAGVVPSPHSIATVAGLAPHPLDEAIARSQADIDAAQRAMAAQAETELHAILSNTEGEAAPVDCPQVHEINETHYSQCTLKPGHLGIHAVSFEGSFYPLNLAPQPTWKNKKTGATNALEAPTQAHAVP